MRNPTLRKRQGFTLVELMVVIAIIGILLGLLMVGMQRVRITARETQCKSNLGQLHKALMMYRTDNEANGKFMPYRLTYLIRSDMSYAGSNPKIFRCPFDTSDGHQGGKPPRSVMQFAETDEPGAPARANEYPCSYMYEFSGATCSWDWKTIGSPPYPGQAGYDAAAQRSYFDTDNSGDVSWGEVKWKQMEDGDSYLHPNMSDYNAMAMKGYPPSCFPLLRCFWHQQNPDSDEEKDILNQSFEGRCFSSGALWETTLRN